VNLLCCAFELPEEKRDELRLKTQSLESIVQTASNDKALEKLSNLIKLLAVNHLKTNKAPEYTWNGELSDLEKSVLTIYSKSKGLKKSQAIYAKWFAYTKVHSNYPIDPNFFLITLQQIKEKSKLESVKCLLNTAGKLQKAENMKMFWAGTDLLTNSFSCFIGKLNEDDSVQVEILTVKVKVMNKIRKIKTKNDNFDFEKSIESSITMEKKKMVDKMANKEILTSGRIEEKLVEVTRVMKIVTEYLCNLGQEFEK
jgi:hypothetical protein